MRQFLRKRALAAVLSAAVLVGLAQPAVAALFNPTYRAQVTPNGVGDLLVFSYWTTDERNSLIAITNAFGGQATRYVHFRLREGVNSDERVNFTICLSPGDVWTAAITKIPGQPASTSTLLVGNPGSCDGSVRAAGFTAPPLPGDPVGLNAEFGYIEAYTMECRTTPGCSPVANDDGGDDTLTGVATLVSVAAGFSSSYNATSLIGFDAVNEAANVRSPNNVGRAHSTIFNVGGLSNDPAPNSTGSARRDVANALANEGGVSKEILMGRWTANPTFNSRTDVVLTFPTADFPGTPDPVSIWVFDEEENFNFSPREIALNWEVNICTFEHQDNTPSGETELTCNGDNTVLGGAGGRSILGPGGTFTSGWFRILNNNDRVDGGIGDGSGREFDNINAIPDSTFPAIGLVFSFFEGVTGVFDQSYPIQWAAITGQGGIGDPRFCSPGNGPGFPGCNGFDISSQFRPSTAPNAAELPGSNNTLYNRNRRSNTANVPTGETD